MHGYSSGRDGHTVNAVLAFSVAGAVTFLLRSSMILAGMGTGSPRPARWIALVTPAVLTAMLVSALVVDHGVVTRPPIAEPLAILAAVVGVRRFGNVSVALAVGLPVYWLAHALG